LMPGMGVPFETGFPAGLSSQAHGGGIRLDYLSFA